MLTSGLRTQPCETDPARHQTVNGVIQWGSATAWDQTLYLAQLINGDGYRCSLSTSNAGGSDGSPLGRTTPVARDAERSGDCVPRRVDPASPMRTLNGTITKYYYFGSQRVAMNHAGTLTYLYADHLGSTSVTTDASGGNAQRQTYYAYGTVRTTDGLPTDYTFTGQKLDASASLLYYGARYYDAAVARFIQPDSVIPDPYHPQSLNRYSYTLNNPVRYTDPTGHDPADSIRDFLNNTLLQWAYVNSPTQQAREACTAEMAKAQDPVAAYAGRSFGNGLALWQAASEMVGGYGLITGGGATGLLTCAETLGGGCVVGAGVALGGAALTLHGAGVGYIAVQEEIKLLTGQVSMSAGKGTPVETEEHHLLPQQENLKKKFEKAGLDIEDYKVTVPKDFHKDLHGKGGGDFWENSWNPQWEDFFEQNPDATRDEILIQLHEMAEEFDIP